VQLISITHIIAINNIDVVAVNMCHFQDWFFLLLAFSFNEKFLTQLTFYFILMFFSSMKLHMLTESFLPFAPVVSRSS
jgi:hypothetical protein